jgi:hypothetical protein
LYLRNKRRSDLSEPHDAACTVLFFMTLPMRRP